jgi:hypothetical protein
MNEKEIIRFFFGINIVAIVQLTQTYSYFKVTGPSPQEDPPPLPPSHCRSRHSTAISTPERAKPKTQNMTIFSP